MGSARLLDARVLEAAPDALLVVDRRQHVVLVNRQAEVLFGCERTQLVGQRVKRLIPGRSLWSYLRSRRRIVNGQHTALTGVGLECFGRVGDGEVIPIEVSLSHLEVDGDQFLIAAIRDISERRQREAHAAERASQFDATFEAMADGMTVFDVHGHIVRMNAAGRAMLGAESDLATIDGNVLQQRLDVRDMSGVPLAPSQNVGARVLRGGVALTDLDAVELQLHTFDGRAIEVSVSGAPVRDALGRLVGAVAVFHDVTGRRRLERRTHAVLDTMLMTVETLAHMSSESRDATGSVARIRDVCQDLVELVLRTLGCRYASLAALDLATEQILPQAVAGLAPEHVATWRESLGAMELRAFVLDPMHYAQIRAGQTCVVRVPVPLFDQAPGGPTVRDWLVVPMLQGDRLVGLLSVLGVRPTAFYTAEETAVVEAIAKLAALVIRWDVLMAEQRARAEAEDRLRLLQTILAEMPCGVYLVRGYDARLVLASRIMETVIFGAEWPIGQPMAEFIAQSGTQILSVDGAQLPQEAWATLRALRMGMSVRHQQEIIRHADGGSVPVLVNALPLDARLYGLGSAAPHGGEDAAVLEPLALVVHQDVSALKAVERLKDEFIAVAAHELRTPLAALTGYAEMFIGQSAHRHTEPLDEWQSEALESIHVSATRLAELIDDLLDTARLQAGRLELRLEPVDLVALAHRVCRRMRGTSERHQVYLHTSATHVIVHVDARRIEQVVTNLIGNAIKYSPAGGDVEVEVLAEVTRDCAGMTIRDSGIGIPEADRVQIFGRFARATNATALGLPGTGLGLHISRELVAIHGGQLWFESVAGHGTTFHLTVPLYAEADTEADETAF